MGEIQFLGVTKVYGGGTPAVRDLTLTVQEGEFVVLVGPSGCGKTTALRMVAGLEEITAGEIRIGNRVVNELAPRERDIAMVFQNYALYPHKSVYDNLAFGLRMRKVAKDEQRRRVEEIARVLGLEEMLHRRPSQLSGGQRQRVAMGRAIVREPQAFLMDEPLSNLDAKLRVQMRAEIARIQQTLRVTTLYVTHDQVEAMTMGHRVAVMRNGVLQQVDTPDRLYHSPGNLFVASFLGSPAMNLLEVELAHKNDSLVCRLGQSELELARDGQVLHSYVGRRIALGVRPENVAEASGETRARVTGRALLVESLGAEALAHVEVSATSIDRPELVDVPARYTPLLGDTTATVLARLPHDTRLRPGDVVDLAVDTSKLHFFDLETGLAIPAAEAAVPAVAVS
jgi:multiple sugar transport system ATP-binding protein